MNLRPHAIVSRLVKLINIHGEVSFLTKTHFTKKCESCTEKIVEISSQMKSIVQTLQEG